MRPIKMWSDKWSKLYGTENYSVVVDGQQNRDAAWYYADPKPAAKNIASRVAFWKGVKVEP